MLLSYPLTLKSHHKSRNRTANRWPNYTKIIDVIKVYGINITGPVFFELTDEVNLQILTKARFSNDLGGSCSSPSVHSWLKAFKKR